MCIYVIDAVFIRIKTAITFASAWSRKLTSIKLRWGAIRMIYDVFVTTCACIWKTFCTTAQL